MTLQNFIIGLKYQYFRKYLKKHRFDGVPDWQASFTDDIKIKNDGYIYAGHSIVSKDCVKVIDGELHLSVKKINKHIENWSGKCDCSWAIGWVETIENLQSYGTWVWEVKLAKNSWNALWLLRKAYPVLGFWKKFITPEVDVMELLTKKYKLGSTVHWGFDSEIYAPNHELSKRYKPTYKETQFVVRIEPHKYTFFIDGYITAIIKKGTSNKPLFAIMNNAAQPFNFTEQPETFIIKSLKYYKL